MTDELQWTESRDWMAGVISYRLGLEKCSACVRETAYAITWAVIQVSPYKILEYQFADSVEQAKLDAEEFLYLEGLIQ